MVKFIKLIEMVFDKGFFQKFGCCGGGKRGVPKKDAGRGQNVVDEVRGAEKRLVGKIPKR